MSRKVALVNTIGVSFGSVRILIGAFSVFYLLGQGLTLTEIGWIKSFQAAVIVFVDIPLSHYSDKYSRKFSICLSTFCASAWLYLTGISENFSGFLIAEFFNAISLGLMSGTFNSYLYDVSLKYKKSEPAERIFSRYQKYHFFFMGVISLFGSYLYAIGNDQVWFISSFLMLVLFFVSLFLPSDKNPNRADVTTLRESLIHVRKYLLAGGQKKHYLHIYVVISLFLQILIQYWQVMVSYRSDFIDHKILLGVVFFFILMSQSLSGMMIEKSSGHSNLKNILLGTLSLSLLLVIMSCYNGVFTIPALWTIFFSLSAMASIGLAKLVENTDCAMRSTILSSVAVVAKILMLVTMPVCALLIGYFGISFTLSLTIIMMALIKFLLPRNAQKEDKTPC